MPTAEKEVDPKIRVGPWVFGKVVDAEKPADPPRPEEPPKPEPVKIKFVDITIILDRSGSMGCRREETVKAVNDYMRSVDEVPGDGCWSLYTFDDPDSARGANEAFPRCHFARADSKSRPFLELQEYCPRGSTALIDAVFDVVSDRRLETVTQVASSLRRDAFASIEIPRKPVLDCKMLVVIVTDGQENASRKHTREQLRELIAKCTKDGWDFLYLGANQDAFAESATYGMSAGVGNAGTSPYFGGIAASWQATSGGLVKCLASNTAGSATAGTRNWKVDGNASAAAFQGDGLPDVLPKVD